MRQLRSYSKPLQNFKCIIASCNSLPDPDRSLLLFGKLACFISLKNHIPWLWECWNIPARVKSLRWEPLEIRGPLQRNPFYVFPEKGIARPQSQFPCSCVCERFIYFQNRPTYIFPCSRIGRSLVGICKSLTDTLMLKLGLRQQRIPFLGIFVSNFLCCVFAVQFYTPLKQSLLLEIHVAILFLSTSKYRPAIVRYRVQCV
jgi:hypothetical protein